MDEKLRFGNYLYWKYKKRQASLGVKQYSRSALAIKNSKKRPRRRIPFSSKMEAELKARNFLKNEPSHRHSARPLITTTQQASLMVISLKQHKFHKRYIVDTGYGLWWDFMACLYSELHQSEAYLEPSQISTIEPSQENSQRLLATNYFYKKVPRQTLAWTLNTPLSLLKQWQKSRQNPNESWKIQTSKLITWSSSRWEVCTYSKYS